MGSTPSISITAEGKKLRLRFPYNKKLLSLVRGCEGAAWDPDTKTWTAKQSCRTWYVLNEIANSTEHYLKYFQKEYPSVLTRYPLWKRQQKTLDAMHHVRRCILAGDMGVGKTLITFAVIDSLPDDWDVWWVAPKSALRSLKVEYAKWKPTKQISIINPASFHKLVDSAYKPPRILVLDESADYKSPTSKRTKEVLGVSEMMEEAYGFDCAVYLLSGTPAPNSHLDWWSQCEVCRPGFLAEKNIYKFRDRYAYTDNSQGFTTVTGWNESEVQMFPKRLGKMVLRITKKQLVEDGDLTLPDKEYIEHQLPVNRNDWDMAQEILRGQSVLQILGRLRQISDGFLYTEEGVEALHTPKDEKLIELIRGKQRVCIFAAFTASVDKLAALCRINGFSVLRVDGRGWHMDDGYPAELNTFQNVKRFPIPVAFVAQSESGGEGITLTAAEDIIYYSNSFKSRYREQSEDRIYRPGATACRIHDLLYFPTDKKVLTNLKTKMDASGITLEEIRKAFQ